MTAWAVPGGPGRGRPRTVQAGLVVSGQPGFTTELGTPATTPLTSWGKWAPSSSAASPPRDSPATSTWSRSTPGWARSTPRALAKYSKGMLRRVWGRPGALK